MITIITANACELGSASSSMFSFPSLLLFRLQFNQSAVYLITHCNPLPS
jgi:hypothetical protein